MKGVDPPVSGIGHHRLIVQAPGVGPVDRVQGQAPFLPVAYLAGHPGLGGAFVIGIAPGWG